MNFLLSQGASQQATQWVDVGFDAPMIAVGGVGLLNKFGFFGKEARNLLYDVESSERFTKIFLGVTKTEACQLLRSGEHVLAPEQTQKVLRYLRKGSVDRINLKISNYTGEVRLSFERSGRTSGYQRMTYEIDIEGNTNKVVQTVFDDQNQLIHQSPRSPKNNLYDVKQWR